MKTTRVARLMQKGQPLVHKRIIGFRARRLLIG